MLLRGVFAFLLSMATSTQQKQELFKAIWATAEDLRNSVDGWDFKSYVLGILFYRFISENITNYINRMQREAGDADFDYTSFSDEEAIAAKEDLVREKGFFILPSQLYYLKYSRLSKHRLSAQRARMTSKDSLLTLMSTPISSAALLRSETNNSLRSSTTSEAST